MTQNQLSQNPSESNSLVEILNNTAIITEEDKQALSDCKVFIADTYKSVPMYRPLAVKLFGVLDDANFPTSDMKFWQCKVEAETHAMELVRDIHDLELQKNQIERAEFLLKRIHARHTEAETEDLKAEIMFDIKEQTLVISKKKFELFQLQKKIKYRIEEVNEWRQISETLTKAPTFKHQNYAQMLSDSLVHKWNSRISNPNTPDNEKKFLSNQIDMLRKLTVKTSAPIIKTQ
jgi:hypothetical protein